MIKFAAMVKVTVMIKLLVKVKQPFAVAEDARLTPRIRSG